MLRKEDSNKVLKGIKTVVFTTGLTLLNSVNVEAKEINPATINNMQITPLIVGVGLSGSLAISLIGIAIHAHKLNKNNKQNYNTELQDKSAVTEKDGIEHIKIICK